MRFFEELPSASEPIDTRSEIGLPVERRGDPMFVCFGVEARGGGSRGVLREWRVLSRSGPEPGDGSVSIVDAAAHTRR